MQSTRPEPTDPDPIETHDWIESLDAVVHHSGTHRASYLLRRLGEAAQRRGVVPNWPLNTDYVNTIPPDDEAPYPGDEDMERKIRRIIRWNAAVMVHKANVKFSGIGGHLSTYASSATLYEVGFNHFFRGKDETRSGDQIYFQGHAAPGIYARSFLEGRISMEAMDHFRREVERGRGLSSYPHPRLMPNYWQFPTVSMGLGPIASIYQARFNRYLQNRSLLDTSESRVWCFVGDGETDEPETLGSLSLPARDKLDNLIWVVNCNLQRLDGPVRGNGKIIQELEAIFRGAGWNVLKVIWGPEWDPIIAQDEEGILRRRLNEVVDGQWQRYTTAPGDYTRRDFFGVDPRLLKMVEHLEDEDIRKLRRGGHSYRKVYAAYHRATEQRDGRPTVILAHTVKGWTLGEGFEGSNITHQKKKLEREELKAFRDLLELPVPDDQLDDPPFYHPGKDSREVQYMMDRRRQLGGLMPARLTSARVALELPDSDVFEEFYGGSKNAEVSTTMAFARMLAKLLRDKKMGKRVVPIIPDEARTFGMDALFSQVGIYAAHGQLYEPIDKGKLLYYREARDGQVLEEGITEAGSMASFLAAGTSYAVHGMPVVPFYIFYSMFGFQRTGDQIWQFGDAMGRGFLLGATAGRTTLNGEGLQHEDGHSHLLAASVPNVRAYDPAYAYELAVIIKDGLHRMFEEEENVFYYITLENENFVMPAMPEGVGDGILKGMYRLTKSEAKHELRVQLFGSGPMLASVRRAAEMLEERGVAADVWSVTSYQQLRADALAAERYNRLHPEAEQKVPYVVTALAGIDDPIVAASDYVKLVPEQIARFVHQRFVPLGTDGFGMSDTREALRRHFEVDAESVVVAAFDALRRDGKVEPKRVSEVIRELDIDADKLDPLDV